ncbi:hypothetical protein AB0M48_38610 [Lentzea sp. NPDC051208]|uniref:hypothetical protein n=1 Tax=Lentzea sp. NPDC051208 TaxID=3154642 RepID=UPI0034153399
MNVLVDLTEVFSGRVVLIWRERREFEVRQVPDPLERIKYKRVEVRWFLVCQDYVEADRLAEPLTEPGVET